LILIGYFVVVAAIVAAVLPTLLSTVHLIDRQRKQYDPESTAVSNLITGALDQETGVRGYLLTHNESFLAPYTTGRIMSDDAVAALRATPLTPEMTRQVDAAATALQRWRSTFAAPVIADVKGGDAQAAQTLVQSGGGKALFDAFRARHTGLRNAVSSRVATARSRARDAAILSIIMLLIAVGAGVALGLAMLIWWRRAGRRDVHRDRELADIGVLLDSLVNATTNPIFAKDLDGRHVLANRARAASLARGDPTAQMIGHSVADFIDPADAEQFHRDDRTVVSLQRELVVDEVLPQPDGPHVFLTTKSPLYNADGEVIGVVGVARDVTEERALRRDRERLYQIEHEYASTLQRAMLGTANVDDDRFAFCARYDPAVEGLTVGGDWYDVVARPDGTVAVIAGDAVGRGIGAATAMGQLRSAVAALGGSGADPARALESLDRFAATIVGGTFATCALVIVDPVSEKITYTCAGHMPPLIVGPDGATKFLDDLQDPPLATTRRRARRLGVHSFPVGSTLTLFTDGLVERRGESIDSGLERLARAASRLRGISVEDMCDELVAELVETDRQADDVAIVLARLLAARKSPDRAASLPRVWKPGSIRQLRP
jgi:PAS domain S-box-containing protein